MQGIEIPFGIGSLAADGRPAVVVNDQALAVADVAARSKPPAAVPASMRELMLEWDRWHEWLRALDLRPTAEAGWQPIDAVKFSAPVPDPWNLFQAFHNYDRPSRSRGTMGPSKAERVFPDLFFGSRSALAGYGDTVMREAGGIQFDFEVEVTAVMGRTAYRVPAERAEEHIAGYAIGNDYTMHFAWWKEIRAKSRINDHLRLKNFPGYTPMSRVIVPRDLVGDPHDLGVRAWVDGVLRQDTRTRGMLWKVGELVEYLSNIVPLRPGDLILTGSPEELPLPPGRKPGVQPGETLLCEVERIGRLENPIGEHALRHPRVPA